MRGSYGHCRRNAESLTLPKAVNASGRHKDLRSSNYFEGRFGFVLLSQRGACGPKERRYGARQERIGRAPVSMCRR